MAHTVAGFKRQSKIERRRAREEKALQVLNQHNKKLKNEPKIKTKRKAPEEIIYLLPGEVQNNWLSFRIRDPKKWYSKSYNIDRQIKDFARWIFCEYNVPPFMFELFERSKKRTTRAFDNKEFNMFMSWFITIGQGHSFAKAIKDLFTKKEAHIFLNAPSNHTIKQNIWWAKCKSRDIPDNFISFILQRFVHRSYRNHFWVTLLDFIKNNEEELNVETLQEIIDFLPAARAQNENFSLKGRTLNSLIQLSNEWHRAQQASEHGTYQEWEGLPIENWGYKNKKEGIKWTIKQLTNSKQLYSEGRRMRHCVYGYVRSCASGRTGIFTLESDDPFNASQKHLTIEVSGKQIVQARGRLNRRPDNTELNILAKWAAEKHLTMSVWLPRR